MAGKKHGLLNMVAIVIAAVLVISPSYIVGAYLLPHGRLSVPLGALVSLAMFLVGALLMIRLLKE